MAYVGIAAALAILGLGIALKVQGSRLDAAKAETEQVNLQFEGFKKETARIGKESEKKAADEKKRQAAVNQQRTKGYEDRIAAVNDTYRKLRDQRVSAGSSAMPAVPDTSPSADAAASNQRLLEVLQHADLQTARLIELQQWAADQGAVKQ